MLSVTCFVTIPCVLVHPEYLLVFPEYRPLRNGAALDGDVFSNSCCWSCGKRSVSEYDMPLECLQTKGA